MFEKKFLKYRVRKKNANDLDFEEASPFAVSNSGSVFRGNQQIDQQGRIVFFLIFGFIVILLIQTFKLQIVDRQKFTILAENNSAKEITKVADRGVIYDRAGNILAKNNAIFDLVAIPHEIPKDENQIKDLAREIATISGKDEVAIIDSLLKVDQSAFRSELILENMNVSQAIAFETRDKKLSGVEVRYNAMRSYPDAEYFSHIIGYTGRVSFNDLKADEQYESMDFIGKTGLEYFYEKKMRGQKGVEKVEVDAKGKVISVIDKKNTVAGANLTLSINSALQKKLQDTITNEIKKMYGARYKNAGVAAVALDPQTGKILALVSLPSYDNNIFVNPGLKEQRIGIFNESSKPLFNRVISGLYPPGSTIKPIMAVAALKEGIVDENTIIKDGGVIDIFYHGLVTHFRGWKSGGLGLMNVVSAIAMSSDIYFYTVGGGYGNFIGLGADKISEYFKMFNLGEKFGIDLPGEAGGFVPDKKWKKDKYNEEWTIGNTYHLSIGQGYLLTTPLQVALWTAFFANGGTLYKPEIVDKITNSETNIVLEEIKPEIIKNKIIDEKFINIARRGMREVVTNGTAGLLKNSIIPIAGKTGTAQFGTDGKTHSWFTSFAPYDNPEIVLTILIEGGGEGSSTAVPITKDVLDWYFSDKNK